MLDRKEELEIFKVKIDLRHYAETIGYSLNRKESSRNSTVLSHPNGDKIVVALGADNHWIYFSVRDDSDHGTIIDFVQNRNGCSLGIIRKNLRSFLNLPHSPTLPTSNFPKLTPTTKDGLKIQVELQKMELLSSNNSYLERRCIPKSVYTHDRFHGKILIDQRSNTIFPHYNLSGVCGYEIKNFEFTGFSSGGEKGLWSSKVFPSDDTLVITESSIDALSYFALNKQDKQRLISFSGSFNPNQLDLIQLACKRFSIVPTIILAVDNDTAGDKFCVQIKEALQDLNKEFQIIEDRPKTRNTDWNDVLRKKCSDV